jgi:hypothetical protein
MSLEHSPARSVSAAAFTVTEFCQAHRVSRSALYELWSQGLGPRYFLNGTHRRISIEAAADWRAAREVAACGSSDSTNAQAPADTLEVPTSA